MSGGSYRTVPPRLRRQWRGVALLSVIGASVGYFVLSDWWTTRHGGWWVLIAGGVAAVELTLLRWYLTRGRPEDDPGSSLGAANFLTVGRGLLIAAVAGFLPLARPDAAGLWVPAGLYAAAVVLDYLDGIVARRFGRVTRLGTSLDEAFDTVGLLVAPTVGVLYAQLPAWYLAVPLAKPAYLVSLRAVRAAGSGALEPLPHSRLRRPLASLQMVVTAVALSPAVTPPATTVLATAAMAPYFVVFVRDWLVVAGLRGR